MFPIIYHISDLESKVVRPEINKIQKDDFTVFAYAITDNEDLFFSKNGEYERECRGITFNKEGKIVSRSLHKFFNINERATTQEDKLDFSKITRVMEKRDGSAIFTVETEDGFLFKTKRTFDSDEAIAATNLLTDKQITQITTLVKLGYTLIFEYTSPQHPIVLIYDKPQLTLLHIRDNMSGKYHSEDQIKASKLDFPLPENFTHKFKVNGKIEFSKIKEAALNETGVEGWIFQFENGDMVKQKTAWYVTLHHAVTFIRYRDVAKAVLEDSVDDLIAYFTIAGKDVSKITEIRDQIYRTMAIKENDIAKMCSDFAKSGLSNKELASLYKNHPDFSMVMKCFRGAPYDLIKWYKTNHLHDWSLEVI